MAPNTSDRQLLTVLLVVLAAFVLVPVLFMGTWMMGVWPMTGGWPMMGGPGGSDVRAWLVAASVGVSLLFFALVLGGYLVFRAASAPASDTDSAHEALRTAYARGDLDYEEYEERKATLERDG